MYNQANSLSAPDMLLIFLAILILFGAPKLPEFVCSLGKSMRIFKEEADNLRREFAQSEPAPTPSTRT